MSAGQDAYNRSRYEQARKDLRAEIEVELREEFEAQAPVKLIELAERFVIAVEAIARAKGVPAQEPTP
ncbi:crotonobetainyl-CoA:carnitine CoA-transferase CaiB-like acyl-CoA transferase [Bosea sp. BE271]|uniref:hypothetical protein n=1 Tax=Bosea TaxID=85413 RepID=UPI0028645B49|nr:MULTISPECIES: hypothetical protein [Bosea]MDR6826472.1 crotonobetainyl-CoA:carnitine CoA-transferase CaiB-like acyl-CoA transferase [Bosea robiniae]MDR6893182.1 crotonobetainyl-CoA:carnitine CoA-transferase CaiB-like acyl-CoA transferase [Bosea sp. BE109]MDR7137119.1 crotonobetainyl-CoA:carnitine CoA-transferase CaiB-like acyl-CoA transferase [Bosea sp. BE168]MDR7173818.1 crotonobetainyl-CoA:carnitine CoA-transferase CaiB-like acyl-CoA transferase [Bosea sp. BE271]